MRYDYKNEAGGIREFDFAMGKAPAETTVFFKESGPVVYKRVFAMALGRTR